MKAGLPIAMINFNLRSRSLAHCILSSEAKILIVGEGEDLLKASTEILDEIPGVNVYCMSTKLGDGNLKSFGSLMDSVNGSQMDRSVRNKVGFYSTCVYIYTSGTTGLPKPAIVPQVRMIVAGCTWSAFDMAENDVTYITLPLYHSAGLLIGVGNTITSGATLVLRGKFSTSHFWEDCRRHNVTVIQYIGEVCRYLVSGPKRLTNDPVAFVKFDLDTQAPARDKTGWCILIKPGEIGLGIVPLNTGRASFPGYKGKKEDTEKKLFRNVFEEGDVYFNTGDLFRVDTNYYLYFNDRVGDTFRWKGENVSTTEVSNVISELDFIHDASIYGVKIPGCEGRAGMASIHLKDPNQDRLSPIMLMKLSKHCNAALPAYARPRFIRVQKELDLTSTFKQSKENLKQEEFDITKIRDPLYYLHPTIDAYFPLDQTIYYQIISGNIPM
ncbi:hypothetical protein CHS0354_029290 [Potamilus streckersoni]|uniref:long-chain-fatty-acid--CoA ligase n=1 Tax=Potamilus streckersoni TaxID=2493646 RepID=A0AAE0W4S0_9BIVA|nr:hypothetical protein CHS0354_029290 [Potamilus streckersoni]